MSRPPLTAVALFCFLTFFLAMTSTPATAELHQNSTNDVASLEAEPIDQNTQIVATSYEDGQAVLTIYSETDQSVTLTDAFGEGEVHQETRTLVEGTNRVTFSVTEYRGNAGLTIETPLVLWRIHVSSPMFQPPGSPTDSDILTAAGTVFFLFVVALPFSVKAIGHWRGEINEIL